MWIQNPYQKYGGISQLFCVNEPEIPVVVLLNTKPQYKKKEEERWHVNSTVQKSLSNGFEMGNCKSGVALGQEPGANDQKNHREGPCCTSV